MYDKNHCWQYDIRLSNLTDDIANSGFDKEELESLRVPDYTFRAYDLSVDKSMFGEAKQFIERHEWLGTVSNYPTHLFTATYKGILSGVVFHDMPTAFSKLLGEDTKQMERLISRGACISFSPKGLASSLIMYSIRWSAANTPYKLFTAYSDVEAKELGTIYQACNFIYLGQKFGAKKQYRSPVSGKWISDRSFRSRSAYKRYAKDLGVEWGTDWSKGDKVYWENIPDPVEKDLREKSKTVMAGCVSRDIQPKHKYAYILGTDKRDTRRLKRMFVEKNGSVIIPYPKLRGK